MTQESEIFDKHIPAEGIGIINPGHRQPPVEQVPADTAKGICGIKSIFFLKAVVC